MSKSTRMTPEQLELMGLVEIQPGVYKKKGSEEAVTIPATPVYNTGAKEWEDTNITIHPSIPEPPLNYDNCMLRIKDSSGPELLFRSTLEEAHNISSETFKSLNELWSPQKQKVHVAIDPGKAGAIVFFDNKGSLHKWPMPLLGDDIDGNELYAIINGVKLEYDPVILIEDVHSIFGASAKSNWQFGFVCGFIRAMVIANGIPFHMIQPKEWQKLIWTNDDKVYKPKKPEQKRPSLDTKATSLKAAQRMFPHCDFRKNERSKIPHDGIIDACLISTYGRRINL